MESEDHRDVLLGADGDQVVRQQLAGRQELVIPALIDEDVQLRSRVGRRQRGGVVGLEDEAALPSRPADLLTWAQAQPFSITHQLRKVEQPPISLPHHRRSRNHGNQDVDRPGPGTCCCWWSQEPTPGRGYGRGGASEQCCSQPGGQGGSYLPGGPVVAQVTREGLLPPRALGGVADGSEGGHGLQHTDG